MSDREEEPRATQRGRGGQSPVRYVYGALLVAIGGCLGIVIGSVSDSPRILFERLRGPVETVDLEPPAPASAAAPEAPAPLEAFGELQGAAAAKPKPAPKAAERDLTKTAPHRIADNQRARQHPDGNQPHTFPEDHQPHVHGGGAQRHPYADLSGALAHGIGNHSVNSNRSQNQGDAGETTKYHHIEARLRQSNANVFLQRLESGNEQIAVELVYDVA
jgi:hypothetical protein